MTEQKRGRGRPKKVDVESENPDCQPATRGYVKCVARQVWAHTHEQCGAYSATLICAITGWMVFALLVIFGHFRDEVLAITIGSFVIGVVCTAVYIDIRENAFAQTLRPTGEIPKVIQKYTPPEPACEKKKECE